MLYNLNIIYTYILNWTLVGIHFCKINDIHHALGREFIAIILANTSSSTDGYCNKRYLDSGVSNMYWINKSYIWFLVAGERKKDNIHRVEDNGMNARMRYLTRQP